MPVMVTKQQIRVYSIFVTNPNVVLYLQALPTQYKLGARAVDVNLPQRNWWNQLPNRRHATNIPPAALSVY